MVVIGMNLNCIVTKLLVWFEKLKKSILNKDIREVKKAKCLGVLIDNELKWHKQVNSVTQKVFCKLSLIRRLKPYLDINTLNILYKSLV